MPGSWRARAAFAALACLVVTACALASLVTRAEAAAPVGQGFELNVSDMKFILKQIKIAEHHAISETDPDGNPLLGNGQYQVSSALLPYGLRTVDGSYNNLIPGQSGFGATKQLMPRHTTPQWRAADDSNVPGVGPVGPPGQTSYANKNSNVVDSQPRIISNLIVDQTVTNPAAVAAAGRPHRHFNPEPSAIPCDVNDLPVGCTPKGETLFIPNVTTDVGLSPPFNSFFTIFGQFFDHGLDLTAKAGAAVFVPLKADDPLIPGEDGVLGTADDLPPNMRFMVLTRAKNQPGPDGILGNADDVQEATNLDSSWVDQSQTYTSHESHQVFLRQYYVNAAGKPMETGKMIEGDLPGGGEGGMATWAKVKQQTRDLLGFQLSDKDALNIPLVLANQYGRFLRGPNGYPQLMTDTGVVEGNPAAPVAVPANVKRIDIAFLDDIAHTAVPKSNLTADGDGDTGNQPPAGTYDNELLDTHFIAGDGRVNENIALTAIHQVFHSEHNRLVGYMQNLISGSGDTAFIDEWKLNASEWNGDRLLQAARFVTEMEYQHLVFEEFARHVQPGINPFNVFTQSMTDINTTIHAEFAHAVYRFGHSLLTDTVARRNEDGSDNSLPLLTAFLNPPSYYDKGGGQFYSAEEAAGSIAQGMTDQVANELDEFVAETLRSNLLGLPLDLAAINMTRAREAGIPSMNNFRKQIYAKTNDSAMQPYQSWVDYALGLKHMDSVINYMAAYGQHPTILFADAGSDGLWETTGDNAAPTLASRREAARKLYEQDEALNPGTPTDAADFVNSSGAWANGPGGVSKTGLDDVDLWIGGLGEMQNLFGGLLGSTFNYVFEAQMQALQDGDRLYYLSRTSGMELRTALEGNSFAELVMRNTSATALKADAFDTADCEFDLNQPNFVGTGNVIADDPLSECDESKVLIRMADGTIRYRVSNSVDPPGINAQNIFNGTSGPDKMWGGVDLDTFWGNGGNDRIEGNDGGDLALGGEGNDIITDSAGDDDILKGGPGNDAIDAGPGLDVIMGGDGHDFANGGENANQHFMGEGDDFVIAGGGADTVFGGGGDDWQEGGGVNDLLQGDSGAPFFDDVNAPGSDVLIGEGGEDDYDAEGGDDIMVAGPGIERNHGAFGWDWATHASDPQPAVSDLTILVGETQPVQLADRYLLVEGLSGWKFDDVLKGDSSIPQEADEELHGAAGLNTLYQAGINRVNGLQALLPPGTTQYGTGNIIMGGSGSDRIMGRGADDIIDGDAWLNVRLSVRTDRNNPATEVRSAERLGELQNEVFAGNPVLDPGKIAIVREIKSNPNPTDVDTAEYGGPRADYDISYNASTNSFTVVHARNVPCCLGQGVDVPGGDGTDILKNIEKIAFCVPTKDLEPCVDGVYDLGVAAAPAIGTATAGTNFNATVRWTAPAGNLIFPITGYRVQPTDSAGNPVGAVRNAVANATSLVVTGLTGGNVYRFKVAAVNTAGTGAYSALSNAVTIAGDNTAPTVIARSPVQGAVNVAAGANVTATFSEDVQGATGGFLGIGANVLLRRTDGATCLPCILASVTYSNATRTVTINPSANLANTVYRVSLIDPPGAVQPIRDLAGNPLADTTWTFRVGLGTPPAPLVGSATRGAAGGPTTATIRWTAPPGARAAAIRGYQVTALRMSSRAKNARVLKRIVAPVSPASARAKVMTLRTGIYRFTVVSVNAKGKSPVAGKSNVVVPR